MMMMSLVWRLGKCLRVLTINSHMAYSPIYDFVTAIGPTGGSAQFFNVVDSCGEA